MSFLLQPGRQCFAFSPLCFHFKSKDELLILGIYFTFVFILSVPCMNTVDSFHGVISAMIPVAEIQADFYLKSLNYQIW